MRELVIDVKLGADIDENVGTEFVVALVEVLGALMAVVKRPVFVPDPVATASAPDDPRLYACPLIVTGDAPGMSVLPSTMIAPFDPGTAVATRPSPSVMTAFVG